MHSLLLAGTPKVKGSGIDFAGGTSWASPAWVRKGDLIIAARMSTGGGVQGMGTDFTAIGSDGTGPYDISVAWAIAAVSGSTTYTVPSGGVGVLYVVVRAQTYNERNPAPTAYWAGSQQDHNNAVWSPLILSSRHLAICGTYSVVNILPAQIPGSFPLWSNTGGDPYTRGFYRLGGWPALDLANAVNGTAGQFCKTWAFAVNPR